MAPHAPLVTEENDPEKDDDSRVNDYLRNIVETNQGESFKQNRLGTEEADEIDKELSRIAKELTQDKDDLKGFEQRHNERMLSDFKDLNKDPS